MELEILNKKMIFYFYLEFIFFSSLERIQDEIKTREFVQSSSSIITVNICLLIVAT